MLVLGIESSCDETAAAVVKDGYEVLSSVIHTQIALHAPHGGVVPEIASRSHIEKIPSVIQAAIEEAGIKFEDIDAVASRTGRTRNEILMLSMEFALDNLEIISKPQT